MKKILWIIILLALTGDRQALAVDVRDTRMLSQPAISQTHIAFIYAGDLWVADHDGKNVRRLTTDPGSETNPAFSPDGSLIAFGAQYEGNTDVYLVSVSGGVPKRLTWHPGPDFVQGFAPNGKAVLFASPRNAFNDRYWQLYKVNLDPGFPEELDIPNGQRATYSPDGTRLAYNPLAYVFSQWKHYRGGSHAVISLYKFSDHSIERIPQPQGGCNDADPMWMGDTVYFRSDRNGEFNLFSFDLKTQTIKPLTQHQDFPVLYGRATGRSFTNRQAICISSTLRKAKAKRLRLVYRLTCLSYGRGTPRASILCAAYPCLLRAHASP